MKQPIQRTSPPLRSIPGEQWRKEHRNKVAQMLKEQEDMPPTIEIFCGNFGSGKTELAVAKARHYAARKQPVTLIDLDLVNPYFTATEQRAALEALGVCVHASPFATSGIDTPALPPAVATILAAPKGHVVVDLGGDPTGAIILGSLAGQVAREYLTIYGVVNAYRPFTQDVQGVMAMLLEIMQRMRLPIDGLINNANLADETSIEHLQQGQQVLQEVSAAMGLPIVAYGVQEQLAHQAQQSGIIGEPMVLYKRVNRPQ